VIVQVENQGTSFAAGIDAATGETRWRHARQEESIWSSPTLLSGSGSGGHVVLMQSRDKLTAHDARSGEHLWDYEASCNTMASAFASDGVVYLPSHGVHALKPGPGGRVELKWHESRLRSSAASPVLHQGRLYVVKPPAILVCGDAESGEILWQLRLGGRFWATPVAAGDHLFAVNHDGLVHVVRLGDEGQLVGKFQIDKAMLASPAVADGAVYFRSDEHLWKIASP
jgi:outer membrane protein assembly factor BamB